MPASDRFNPRSGNATLTVDGNAVTAQVQEARLRRDTPQEPVTTFGTEDAPEFDSGSTIHTLSFQGFLPPDMELVDGGSIVNGAFTYSIDTGKSVSGTLNEQTFEHFKIAGRGVFMQFQGVLTGEPTVAAGA